MRNGAFVANDEIVVASMPGTIQLVAFDIQHSLSSSLGESQSLLIHLDSAFHSVLCNSKEHLGAESSTSTSHNMRIEVRKAKAQQVFKACQSK